ncbi:MAG: flagellar assembly peptidoglycan hydrolase FlgJ [Chromatiales bacterium]|jgi:peptidoglycan hydrolase FlgJ|nr:flagellar assembly peptidoglycan hydrolase FlgJ [Chromatiales bacterium]
MGTLTSYHGWGREMNPSGLDARVSGAVYTDLNGLAALRAQARAEPDAALVQAAQQFESLFIQMMLSSMRAAKLGDGILDSDATEFYQDLYDKQMSLAIGGRASGGSGSGLGIADLLVRQLRTAGQHEPAVQAVNNQSPNSTSVVPAPTPVTVASPAERVSAANQFSSIAALPATSATQPNAPVARPSVEPVNDVPARVSPDKFDSPRAFVRELWADAERAARDLGTEPQALLAQAALESGWGTATARHADGRSSHNLFGIKAHGHWSGDRVQSATHEYERGQRVARDDAFRAYNTYADSFADYVNFLTDNPRYRAALKEAADPQQFFNALQRAGYATDPTYANKLMSVLSGSTMRDALAALK